MWQHLLIFVIKILVGTTIGAAGVYHAKRRKKMRIFDNLTHDCKVDILEAAVAYAKADIDENNLNVDLVHHACGFGEMWFLQEADFTLIEPELVVAWIGGRPPHRPKVW